MSKKLIDDLFSGVLTTITKEKSYEEYKLTPENMSYWFDEIFNSSTRDNSVLKIPETKVIQLDFEHWNKLTEDGGNEDSIEEINVYLKRKLGDFQKDKSVFLKTGVFSNKFEFSGTICSPDRNDLGSKLYAMYYMSMMVGANRTTEAVFRQFIESVEDVPTIYEGMPLHTEFRVFYDFDIKELVGVSNYWHPELMTKENLREDYEIYATIKDKIEAEYESKKDFVMHEVAKLAEGVSNKLTGRWSIDVMKNGEDYWLIDMARMEYSSLRNLIDFHGKDN